MDKAIVILAAGKGTRMGGDTAKVLAQTPDGSLIELIVRECLQLEVKRIVVVVGYQAPLVESHLREVLGENSNGVDISFAVQEELNGTGGAVKAALPSLQEFQGEVLICCGDTPLLRAESLQRVFENHERSNATLSLVSFRTLEPASYGRIVRDPSTRQVKAIREAKDCSEAELLIDEVNAGLYVVDSAFLSPAVNSLEAENAQKEYYLTDIVEKAVNEGQNIHCSSLPASELLGVNTPEDLEQVISVLNGRRVSEFLSKGVRIQDPSSTFIGPEVSISSGAVLGPNVILKGKTSIGSGVIIEGSAFLEDTVIEDNCLIRFSCRSTSTRIGPKCKVGPFAHLREGTELSEEVHIGNFVETKKTIIGRGSKANHLSYLGDGTVGEGVNVGAGTIFCNYDGYNKFKTQLGDGVFIGSNSSIVAPVSIGKGAIVAAGSTITKDVASDALAVERSEQRNLEGGASRFRLKRTNKKVR